MKCFIGIDLGSTTTKAILLNEKGEIFGRGITNSRSNYAVASKIAKNETFTSARFTILRARAKEKDVLDEAGDKYVEFLYHQFSLQSFLHQLKHLRDMSLERSQEERYGANRSELRDVLSGIFDEMESRAIRDLADPRRKKSDFFRDLAGSLFQHLAEEKAKEADVSFDQLMSVYDRVIFQVENEVPDDEFSDNMKGLLIRLADDPMVKTNRETWHPLIEYASTTPFDEVSMVGTGYGRQTLPFPKENIQSEILCHGYGAHHMFEGTATVLDIGGQDTKAIQVDPNGVVTSFQMNDRCAAGCGRYLGYIADELSIGLHELGPMALQAGKTLKINSTCTVFAGAELRDRLALGEKRADILSGLHRAIILRSMSLLARSGGVKNEFTFTGGVAKNPAAVKALKELIEENYGELKMNIHPDSIFTGALGAALFALRKPTMKVLPMTRSK